MQVTTQFTPLSEVQADWLIVSLYEGEDLPADVAQLDAQLGGTLARLKLADDLTGKNLELTPLRDCKGIGARRVLAVGLGKRAEADRACLTSAAAAAARSLTARQLGRIAVAL